MVQQDTCTKSFQQGCITCSENETHGDIWPFGQEKLIKTDYEGRGRRRLTPCFTWHRHEGCMNSLIITTARDELTKLFEPIDLARPVEMNKSLIGFPCADMDRDRRLDLMLGGKSRLAIPEPRENSAPGKRKPVAGSNPHAIPKVHTLAGPGGEGIGPASCLLTTVAQSHNKASSLRTRHLILYGAASLITHGSRPTLLCTPPPLPSSVFLVGYIICFNSAPP